MNRPRGIIAHIAAAWGFLVMAHTAAARAQSAADYVVSRGDNLSTIAQRLNVPVRLLARRNHLAEPYALRTGQTLRIPVVEGVASQANPHTVSPGGTSARRLSSASARGDTHGGMPHCGAASWGRPRHPGLVSLVREYDDERLQVNLRHPSSGAMRRMRHFLRFVDGASHDMDPRLMRQLAVVSDHFGGRTVHVISGFRPFRQGQWTPHSNHNVGHAVDFRVEGVPNRVARDFCRTLPATGCGYYPRSVFIHMDTRCENATWVDWSRPGQRPLYGSESHPPAEHTPPPTGDASSMPPGADEELDDVVTSSPSIRTAAPEPDPEAPAASPTDTPPPASTP